MDVHALVNVEEERNTSRWIECGERNLLKLTNGLNECLVLSALDRYLDVKYLVTFLIRHDSAGVHLLDQFNQVGRHFVGFSCSFSPCSDQIISPLVVEELESVQVILPEEGLVLHILDYVLLEHFLADHQNFLLVWRYSLSEPVENFFTAAALRMLAEPTVLVVEHLNVLVHYVRPLF